MADEEAAQAAATGDTGSAADEPLLNPGAAETGTVSPAAGQESGAESAPENREEESGILTPGAGEAENENLGAPESYGEFTVPDGFTVDDDGRTRLHELFRSLNLSQKGGQKLVDAFAERVTGMKEAELAALSQKRKAWRAEIRQRPNYAADRALALKGLRAVVSEPEEVALFHNSWMSDHPALFSMFVKVGKLLGEDSPLSGGGQSPREDSAVTRFPVKL